MKISLQRSRGPNRDITNLGAAACAQHREEVMGKLKQVCVIAARLSRRPFKCTAESALQFWALRPVRRVQGFWASVPCVRPTHYWPSDASRSPACGCGAAAAGAAPGGRGVDAGEGDGRGFIHGNTNTLAGLFDGGVSLRFFLLTVACAATRELASAHVL